MVFNFGLDSDTALLRGNPWKQVYIQTTKTWKQRVHVAMLSLFVQLWRKILTWTYVQRVILSTLVSNVTLILAVVLTSSTNVSAHLARRSKRKYVTKKALLRLFLCLSFSKGFSISLLETIIIHNSPWLLALAILLNLWCSQTYQLCRYIPDTLQINWLSLEI